jgi:hypothetical protein
MEYSKLGDGKVQVRWEHVSRQDIRSDAFLLWQALRCGKHCAIGDFSEGWRKGVYGIGSTRVPGSILPEPRNAGNIDSRDSVLQTIPCSRQALIHKNRAHDSMSLTMLNYGLSWSFC